MPTTKSRKKRLAPSIDRRLDRTKHPLVYEVNTRVLVRELSAAAGRKRTLEDLPEEMLEEWESLGFDAIWLMGVWTTGRLGEEIARLRALHKNSALSAIRTVAAVYDRRQFNNLLHRRRS